MATKTENIFVIDCICDECHFHHKDEVYSTREEAYEELEKIKVTQPHAKVETLYEQIDNIRYWYY